MRLFIAILPDAKVTKSLIAAMHDLKLAGVGGSYTTNASLHLTLAFLGEVPDARPVKESMEKLSVEGKASAGDAVGIAPDKSPDAASAGVIGGIVKAEDDVPQPPLPIRHQDGLDRAAGFQKGNLISVRIFKRQHSFFLSG